MPPDGFKTQKFHICRVAFLFACVWKLLAGLKGKGSGLPGATKTVRHQRRWISEESTDIEVVPSGEDAKSIALAVWTILPVQSERFRQEIESRIPLDIKMLISGTDSPEQIADRLGGQAADEYRIWSAMTIKEKRRSPPPSEKETIGRNVDTTITLIIAARRQPHRHALCSIFAGTKDIQILGGASDGYRAVILAEKLRPDILLIDNAPPLENLEAIRDALRRRKPLGKILIFSDNRDPNPSLLVSLRPVAYVSIDRDYSLYEAVKGINLHGYWHDWNPNIPLELTRYFLRRELRRYEQYHKVDGGTLCFSANPDGSPNSPFSSPKHRSRARPKG